MTATLAGPAPPSSPAGFAGTLDEAVAFAGGAGLAARFGAAGEAVEAAGVLAGTADALPEAATDALAGVTAGAFTAAGVDALAEAATGALAGVDGGRFGGGGGGGLGGGGGGRSRRLAAGRHGRGC